MDSAQRPQAAIPHRPLRWVIPTTAIALSALWLAQGPLIRAAARFAVPAFVRSSGYDIEFEVLPSRFFGPLLLGNVRLHSPGGTDLHASQVELSLRGIADIATAPRRVVRRIGVRDLEGVFHLAAPSAALPGAGEHRGQSWFQPEWPAVIDVAATKVFVSYDDQRHLLIKDAELLLSEDQTGAFRAGELVCRIGDWSKTFTGLKGVSAWRGGVAYLADVALDSNAVVEKLSVSPARPVAFAVTARAFGGSLYADWTGEKSATAALNVFNVSLEGLGRFLELDKPMRGELGLLKFTYNGDPSTPLDAQSSLRIEAKDFFWDKRAFSGLRLGVSFSGRHVKVDECEIEQKSNRVSLRGSLLLPSRDWRQSPVALDVDAAASEVRDLIDLFGFPRNKQISGGMTLEGKISGRLGDPAGWIRVGGWDLRAPGIPAASLRADVTFADGAVNITAAESHSGPDFMRASGEISLRESFAYRGRLEARIREVSRYLEPLGRFAPDWARQGGVILFWDGDGTENAHSGVVSLELYNFLGDLNPVPVNGKFAATYSPGNMYVSRLLLDRGPLSLSASCYLSGKGLSVQDIELFNARERLLRAEIFLPVSFPLLLEGKTWSQTMIPGGDVYADVRTDNVRLGPLANLFGQTAVCEGQVDWKLDAFGPWENPSIGSVLSADGLRADLGSFVIPVSHLEAKASLAQKRIDVSGKLETGGADAAKWSASVPVLGRDSEGTWHFLDRTQPFAAQLDISLPDLHKFAGSQPLAGKFGGSVKASGLLSSPALDGVFDYDKVTAVPVDGLAPVTGFSGQIVFAGSEANLAQGKGKMGEGAFTAEAQWNYADPAKIVSSARISGERLQLFASDKFRFAANLNLAFQRTANSCTATGDVALVHSKANVALSATPQLEPAGTKASSLSLPAPFRIGGCVGDCAADIRVRSADPVELAQGASASVDLWLTGPLREPIPIGMIECSGLQAALPAGPLALSHAKFYFTKEMPWAPVIDLAGGIQLHGRQINAVAWGPLGDHRIELSSAPALPPVEIAGLLSVPASTDRSRKAKSPPVTPAPDALPPRLGMSWGIR